MSSGRVVSHGMTQGRGMMMHGPKACWDVVCSQEYDDDDDDGGSLKGQFYPSKALWTIDNCHLFSCCPPFILDNETDKRDKPSVQDSLLMNKRFMLTISLLRPLKQ